MSNLTDTIDRVIGIVPLDSYKENKVGELLTTITNNLEARLIVLENTPVVTKDSFLAAMSAYWKGEEDIDNLLDSTTNGNTLTKGPGSDDLVQVAGQVGFGTQYNSSNFAHKSSNPTLKITNKVFVAIWVKPNTDPETGGFDDSRLYFGKNVNQAGQFQCEIQNDVSLIVRINSTRGTTPNNLFNPQVGGVICVIYDGSQTGNDNRLKILVNDVQQTLSFNGTIPASINDADADLLVGGDGFDLNFIGLVDELAFANIFIDNATAVALAKHYYNYVSAHQSPIP